jgi:hypothetical protein
MDVLVQGVSLSIVSSVDVQGVLLSSGCRTVRYRNEMSDTGIPMPAASGLMVVVPSYVLVPT